jgi:hypothetical protein
MAKTKETGPKKWHGKDNSSYQTLPRIVHFPFVLHTCNPSTHEAEAGGSQVPGQPELPSETLSQKGEEEIGKAESWAVSGRSWGRW